MIDMLLWILSIVIVFGFIKIYDTLLLVIELGESANSKVNNSPRR